MSRHGWVKPLESGAVARCGGPSLCAHCKAEALVIHGCPTATDLGGDSRCFYCGGDYYKIEGSKVTSTDEPNHEADCPWPPFAEAYS